MLRVERDFVTVDGGCLKRPVRLARSELREGQLVSSAAPTKAATATAGAAPSSSSLPLPPLLRAGPSDVRVGDVLRFHVEHLTGPYGDATLAAEPRPRPAAARAAAWSAVLAAAGAERTRLSPTRDPSAPPLPPLPSTGKVVYGRVLNALPTGGGYAVGVAGVVGFLPFSAAAPSTGARVGVLQRFRVTSAVPATGSFVLEDEGAAARREAHARRQAAWLAAKKEEVEAAGETWTWVERGGGERGRRGGGGGGVERSELPTTRQQQQHQQREQRGGGGGGGGGRGSSSSSASGGGGGSRQQQQQRGNRQHSQRQHQKQPQRGGGSGGAAPGAREEGWYQPPSSRRQG